MQRYGLCLLHQCFIFSAFEIPGLYETFDIPKAVPDCHIYMLLSRKENKSNKQQKQTKCFFHQSWPSSVVGRGRTEYWDDECTSAAPL
jgi:hypothetical protein